MSITANSNSTALKRIKKEYEKLKNDEEEKHKKDSTLKYIKIEPFIEGDLYKWDAYLTAPEGSVYYGAVFKISIAFTHEYPYKPPKVNFYTPVYHPNIGPTGNVCVDILGGEWSPAFTATQVLMCIMILLDNPNPDDPLRQDVADVFKTNKEEYRRRCQESVKKIMEKKK